MSDAKADATAAKALGTAAYKAKNFEEALTHYNKAVELDTTEMVYHLNIAAVYMEMKDYDKAIAAGNKAGEVGMDNRADFKVQAKACARVAKAYHMKGDLTEAVRYYDKALSNHRFKDYLTAKQKVQAIIKEKKRLEKIDPVKAAEFKAKGNEAFKAADYPTAIKEYNEAIECNPDDGAFTSRIFSNRSACYTKLTEFPHALKDAESTIKADPKFIKGYLRKANCMKAMQRYDEATSTYKEALEIDGNNAEAKQGIVDVRTAKYGAQAGMTQEQRAEQAMKDPEIQTILRDPVMQQVLQQMQTDPGAVQNHMKNPEVMQKIMKLSEAGILQMR
jgi:stress-induced-phosphoprotein 1